MSTLILTTKLYTPQPPPRVVSRPRLIERLNEGLHRKLTLISAPAGFGKTTLISAWINSLTHDLPASSSDFPPTQQTQNHALERSEGSKLKTQNFKVAWLSLDEGDSDPAGFLTYLVSALQTVAPDIGEGVLRMLQSPQSSQLPPIESILTSLLNEIATIPDNFVLVLDDYHVLDARAVDTALTFVLEHLPPQMRLIIATREDPQLPLARLRARDQLTELRVTDLRFTPSEAAGFLNQSMDLQLSGEDIDALEARTEGWIAGLQLAAISMQGHQDTTGFVKSFTGSHRFVMDYLVEEVLQQQPESVQAFLLRTSILDRLCGPLCDAVLLDHPASGQETLEYLEHANMFIIPLDNERRWYRYHHLFADLLRQRLRERTKDEGRRTKEDGIAPDPSSIVHRPSSIVHRPSSAPELHSRASQWYEDNGLVIEAFQHAVASNDVDRTARIVQGRGIPLHFRGLVTSMLDWLESLPPSVLNARPTLWTTYASFLLVNGQTTGVEEKLATAEAALQAAAPDDKTRGLIGQIATARATLALTRYDIETMLTQSHRALEYLSPQSLSLRANAYWTMGFAYILQGNRAAARPAIVESVSLSQASGNIFTTILATIALGIVQELDNQLHLAAATYRHVLQMAGDQPLQIVYEAHLGLARVLYEWNDLDTAEPHGRQSLHLARQYDKVIDRFIICEVFLARLKMAQGDVAGAATILAQTWQSARQKNFVYRLPEVAAAQVVTLLRQGNLPAAADLAQTYKNPLSQARVYIARGDASAALALLEPLRHEMDAKGWEDERLKVMILQAIALHANGLRSKAIQVLGDVLALAEPEGFIRIFVDEGTPMAQLLAEAVTHGIMPDYARKLLAVFPSTTHTDEPTTAPSSFDEQNANYLPSSFVEPLSPRELQVLHLIAQGLSNNEIGERLFLALDTVKGHSRKIFGKLQVQRRTEAVARARELGLL